MVCEGWGIARNVFRYRYHSHPTKLSRVDSKSGEPRPSRIPSQSVDADKHRRKSQALIEVPCYQVKGETMDVEIFIANGRIAR
jgi:hypothetical protein